MNGARWRNRVGACLAAGLVLAGCAVAPGPASPSPSASPPPSASPEPSPSASPSPLPEDLARPLDEVALALEPWASGFDRPVFITSRPGDERVYVIEQRGVIVAVDPSGDKTAVLDIRTRVNSEGGERGLLSAVFDPADPTRLFVDYTRGDGASVVEEYAFPVPFEKADNDPIQILLIQGQPFANHNGGQLAFGPDGMLYVGLGDGGGGGDPQNNGQNTSTWLGSILRLDVSARRGYVSPPGNPFAAGGGAPEIWAYGLRNPWRFSFDGDDLYIADVGQGRIEEIDVVDSRAAAGANFGWKVLEGGQCYPSGAACSGADRGFVDPVYSYDHSAGRCSVTGGYVYRGAAYPSLWGAYVFGDFCTGEVIALRVADGAVTEVRNFGALTARISTFGVDQTGQIYVANLADGTVLKVVTT